MGNCLKKTGKDQETETDPEEDGEKENEEPISKPDTEEVPETVWASTPIQTLNQQEDTTAASAPGLSPSNVGALLNAFVQKSNTQAGGNYPASSEAKPAQRAVGRFRVVERCANTPPVSLGRFQSARGYKSTACPVAINKYGVGPGYNYSTGWGTPASNCQDPCPTAKICPSTNQCQSINAYINCYNSCKSTVNNAIVPTQVPLWEYGSMIMDQIKEDARLQKNIDVCRSPSVGVTCNDRLRNGCAPCYEKPRSELDCYSGKMRAEPTCCASAKPSIAPSSCVTPRPCASNAYGVQRIYQPALTQMAGAGRFAPAFTTLDGQQAMFNQPIIGSAVASQLIGRFNPNQPVAQILKNIPHVKSAKSGTSMVSGLSMGSSAKGSSAMGSSAKGSFAKGSSLMGSSIMGSSTKGSSKGSSKKPGVTKPNYTMPKASGNRLALPGGGGNKPKKGGSGTSVSTRSNLSNKSAKGKKGKGKGKKKGKGKGKGKKK